MSIKESINKDKALMVVKADLSAKSATGFDENFKNCSNRNIKQDCSYQGETLNVPTAF